MKKLNKNNKGFSLVEIIVVILIMAIITVALAPQVMKWVNNARIAADAQNYDSLIANIQLAYTNEDVYSKCKGEEYTVKMDNTKTEITGGDATKRATLEAEMTSLTADWAATKAKLDETYTFTVIDGKVTKGDAPDSDAVK